MSKKKNAALIAFGVIALFAVCIVCVYFYAQHIINTPKFEVPEAEPVKSLTQLSDDKNEMLTYVRTAFYNGVYRQTNVSKYKEAWIEEGSVNTDLSDGDKNVFMLSLKSAASSAGEKYNTYEKINSDELTVIPEFSVVTSEIDDFIITQGITQENGEITDDDFYFFEVTIGERNYPLYDHMAITFEQEENAKVLDDIISGFADYLDIEACEITAKGFKVNGKINRIFDHIEYAEFYHTYNINMQVKFKGDYETLGTKNICFDYTVKARYEFTWYGAYFNEKAIYMNPKDSQTLPATVTVRDDAEKGDYELSFTSSDETVVTIDEDGIITALKSNEKPITVTITLKYRGVTYTDELFVTVTDLEVA